MCPSFLQGAGQAGDGFVVVGGWGGGVGQAQVGGGGFGGVPGAAGEDGDAFGGRGGGEGDVVGAVGQAHPQVHAAARDGRGYQVGQVAAQGGEQGVAAVAQGRAQGP